MGEDRVWKGNGFSYSEEEKQFIRDNYKSMSDLEMSKILKRTRHSVERVRNLIKCHRQFYYKMIIKSAYLEAARLIKLEQKCARMRELIAICENENTYKKDIAKKELKKLSGIL